MRSKIGCVIGLVALLSGCYHTDSGGAQSSMSATSSTPVAAVSVAPRIHSSPYSWCPMLVPGTRVETQEMPNGAALEFHTTGDVSAVRARVREMGYFHDQMAATEDPQMILERAMMSPADARLPQVVTERVPQIGGPGMSQVMVRRAMVESNMNIENTTDGARLVLSAKSPWDIPIVRRFASWRANHMATDHCAVMGKPWPESLAAV